ncbi:serine hydrolase [Butyrivibrio fibrisolvens]|uniref:serine hydrolase n=1 Tax=Butyrivibrio fibrisolvens TaxID=831 RepID=UPI0003B4D9EB|nr:serine hydrolase [Butyrivibrio fibrisolvens]
MKKIVLIFVAIFITILMLIVIFGDFKVSSSKIECTTANTNTCTNTYTNTYTDTVINDYIDNFCDETKCSSVSVVVMQEGKITIYGDEDALYQIGSMTKAFTGLAFWLH